MAEIGQVVLLHRGERRTLAFTMDPVVDITDWSIVLTVAARAVSRPKVISATASIVDGPAGQFHVPLTSADTDIDAGTYIFDVWRTDMGQEDLLAVGEFKVKPVARLPKETA